MFARLGRLVAGGWVAWLLGWALLLGILLVYAASLKSVTRPGEFDFLPPDVPSRRGAEVFPTLVIAELQTDFLSNRAVSLVAQIDNALAELRQSHAVPDGLKIAETGSAVVGRDLSVAKQQSARQTSFWTVALIIALLVFVYRAPGLTLVSLATLYVGFNVFLAVLTLGAQKTGIGLFEGIDVYTMVPAYGVGVDYTLFLISRYREELSKGADRAQATVTTIPLSVPLLRQVPPLASTSPRWE
jgi:uncharacterized membrane protein YdfJ with MMPL/SSD domain